MLAEQMQRFTKCKLLRLLTVSGPPPIRFWFVINSFYLRPIFLKSTIMAKNSMFWGQASGKLGEAVLYRSGGQERSRAYVATIKNPRSAGQALSRSSMANLCSAFRQLKPLLSQSFPDRPTVQSAWNAFVKANKTSNISLIPKGSADAGYCAPAGMLVSSGIGIGTILPQYVSATTGLELYEVNSEERVKGGMVVSSLCPPEISMDSGDWSDPSVTSLPNADLIPAEGLFTRVQQLWWALKYSSIGAGLPDIFKFTLVLGEYADDGYKCTLHSVDLSKDSYEELGLPIILKLVTDKKPSEQGASIKATHFGYVSALEIDKLVAFVVSFRQNGKVVVSTSYISPARGIPQAEQFAPGGDVYQQVLSSYQTVTDNIL